MGMIPGGRTMRLLRGEGIECENETTRALEFHGHKSEYWDLPKLLAKPEAYLESLQSNEWVFIPGGFSFADHLGSGRLLAYELNSIRFFERVIERGANIWGVCNGFQVLTASGIFGDVALAHNQRNGVGINFQDRWVKLQAPRYKLSAYCPARHGEGRLTIKSLAPNTEAFLFYDDENFDNGSDQKIAGLVRRLSASLIVGTMPHPEIFVRSEQHPDYNFSDSTLTPEQLKRNSLFKIMEVTP